MGRASGGRHRVRPHDLCGASAGRPPLLAETSIKSPHCRLSIDTKNRDNKGIALINAWHAHTGALQAESADVAGGLQLVVDEAARVVDSDGEGQRALLVDLGVPDVGPSPP